jgi:hypothetical protein
VKKLLFILTVWVYIPTQAQLTYTSLWVQYDSAWTYKNLQLIPIRFKGNGLPNNTLPTNTISFSDAYATGKVTVKEMTVPPGADVGVMVIKNHTKKNILLTSGELFGGGKQDRIVGETAIIPPDGKDYYATVFCVEKGRWANKAKPFYYSGSADMGLRKAVDLNRKQVDIWKEIERKFTSFKKKSETEPYLELYRGIMNVDSSYMNYFVNKMKASDSAYAGFLAVTGNTIIGCEIFSSKEYTWASYKSIVSSYVHSLGENATAPMVTYQQKKNFMDSLLSSEVEQKKFLLTHGRAYEYEGKVIHIIAYGD